MNLLSTYMGDQCTWLNKAKWIIQKRKKKKKEKEEIT